MKIDDIQKAFDKSEYIDVDFEQLISYSSSGSKPWLEVESLIKYLKKNESHYTDKHIIDFIFARAVSLPIYQETKTVALEVYKLFFNLLFKYGRYREAQSQILLLKTKLPDPHPNWLNNYSAKALYKIDINSVFLNPTSFFDMILSGYDNIDDVDSQTKATINDLLNSLPEKVDRHLLYDLSNFRNFVSSIEVINSKFGNAFSDTFNDTVNHLLEIHNFDQTKSKFNAFILNVSLTNSRLLLEQKNQLIEALYNQIESLQEVIENQERSLSKKEDQFQEQLKEIAENELFQSNPNYAPSLNILVLGASNLNDNILYGIAKSQGLSKDQLELVTDYEDGKRYDVNKLKYSSKYSGVLIGPIAHKVIGVGDHSSVIQKFEKEEGFPPAVPIRNQSGELKVTKTAFKESLKILLNTIQSNSASPVI